MKKLLVRFAVAALVFGGIYLIWTHLTPPEPTIGVVGSAHDHADFKIYMHGAALNFSQGKYMSSGKYSLSPFIHVHDGNGDILHKHATGVTLNYFFKSVHMVLNETCLITDSGQSYCNQSDKTVKMFVNGQPNHQFQNYELHDLDRILITYGNDSDTQIKQQIESVTKKACIQSGTCPEKGNATDESSCTTDAGCTAVNETI